MDVLRQNTTIMKSGNSGNLASMEQMYKTVDGYGLKSFVNVVVPSEWLVDGVDRMPTHQFLHCTKVRAAALHNRLQSARRNPLANTIYEHAGCEDVESLGHNV